MQPFPPPPAPRPIPQPQKIRENTVLQNDISEQFQQGNCPGEVQPRILGAVLAFSGGKLGWLSNSVVQSLPEGDVLREKGTRLMPE